MKNVSPNNPCPFLRALAAYEYVKESSENLWSVAKRISKAGKTPQDVRTNALFVIELVAHGLSPLRLLRTLMGGVNFGSLRNGPLDKQGVGSRIIKIDGTIDENELERLKQFAVEMVDPDTNQRELGLQLDGINKMLDANFDRAKKNRRNIDRKLMDGEFPVLLKVMGKGQGAAQYLSIPELEELFRERRLPKRVLLRMNLVQN